jgi:aminopeptidase N
MRSFSIVVLLATIVIVASPVSAQRLPGDVTPTHYDLTFDVDLDNARFSGVEAIHVELTRPSRRIVLNALELQFDNVTITTPAGVQHANVAIDRSTQTVALVTATPVPDGEAIIAIRYHAELNKELRGFYVSTTNTRKYAVTQFESTDARRAFPSFDEPAFKSTFSVRMVIPAGDLAISNGKQLSDMPGPGPGRHTVSFEQTPKMSSYLVAMAVGDFACISDSADDIPLRVCATPGKEGLLRVPMDAAKQILPYLNRFYAMQYPFGKLDLVAVPDFAAGAMENTAAIFYREADLLANPDTASVGTLKRIWSVIAHEMSHQWFGDLVTMRWWNDLWLNEGFATWMELRPLAELKPEWNVAVDQAADTQYAMTIDALQSTRPIRNDVETPHDIDAAFDAIAYQKSGAVLRMIEGYVGTDAFRQGVNAYLQAHAYANATSEDFWNALTAASDKPVDQILPAFVTQPGVPLLEIGDDCASSAAGDLRLEQERFTTQSIGTRSSTSGLWPIPVCQRTATEPSRCSIVRGRAERQACPTEPWTFFNAGASGYYRTQYPASELHAFSTDQLALLAAPERLSLVGDAWALVRTNRYTAADYLRLASAFSREQSSVVLGQVTGRLATIHDDLVAVSDRPKFEQFVRGLLQPLMGEVGFTASSGDEPDRLTLRSQLISALGRTGNDPDVIAQARTALDRLLASGERLEPTAASAIVGVAARHGDTELWQALHRAAQNATSPAERERYLYALPLFEEPALVDRGLALSLGNEIKSQDTAIYLSRFLTNSAVNARAWTFVRRHWSELEPRVRIFGGDVDLVSSLGAFCDAPMTTDIRQFFAAHPLPSASRALDQAIEAINACVELRDRQSGSVASWLSSR